MGELAKFRAIVAREFLERVRSRWFVIITLMGPVLLSAILFLPAWIASRSSASGDRGTVLVIDASGTGIGRSIVGILGESASDLPPVLGAARRRVPAELRTVDAGQLAAAESAATRAVMTKRALGYLVLGPRTVDGDSARYAGRNATSIADMARLNSAVRQAVVGARLERAGIPAARAAEAMRQRGGLKTERLTDRGRGGSGEANVAFALAVAFLLYISIVLYGQNVLRGVLEEKQTRVAEVVVSSVRPTTLLAGKVAGVGSVGLLQILIWIAGTLAVVGYFAPFVRARGADGAAAGGSAAMVASLDFSGGMALTVLLFFMLGYTFYASLYAAAGAMVNTEQEAQQILQPLVLPLVATAVLMQPVLLNPTGSLARTASMVPLSAPIIMPLRMALTPVPWWEVGLAALLLLVACAGAVWIAARIYRVGLLMYGKRPTLRELARWVRDAA